MLWGTTIFTEVLVVPLHDIKHRVGAIKMVSKLGSIKLLEDIIKSYNCARILLHKDKIYHSCSIKFHRANHVVVKRKFVLLEKQVVVSCDPENLLDQVRNNTPVDLLFKKTLFISVVARVKSFHQEWRRWNRIGNGKGHVVLCNGRTLHVFERDPMVLREEISRRFYCAIRVELSWDF